MTRESQEERRKEFKDSMAKSERAMQLPPEEQEKYFIPAEKVFADLREKYGIQHDEPTEEEKKAERAFSCRGIYKNTKANAEMVCRYLEQAR